jgi:PAS domain S-box-containing protein
MSQPADASPDRSVARQESRLKRQPGSASFGLGSSIDPAIDGEGALWQSLDARGEAVTIVDQAGRIFLLNNSASRLLGKHTEALIGSSVWESYPPERATHHKTILKEVFQTGQPATFLDTIRGEWRDFFFFPVFKQDQKASAAMMHSRDASQQVSTESALKRAVLRLATVQEDERRRISRDLHDDIGQRMTALMLELHAVPEAIARGDGTAEAHTASAMRTLEGVLKQIRQIAYQLHPPSLDGMPLAELLAGFCSSFAQSTGLKVEFSAQEDLPAVGPVEATACYRLVQEGLANAVRHSEASLVWVSVDCSDESISISLEDNGRGFDPGHVSSGMGLAGIRERVLGLNGSFEIDSAPDKGTRLTASLPLASAPL